MTQDHVQAETLDQRALQSSLQTWEEAGLKATDTVLEQVPLVYPSTQHLPRITTAGLSDREDPRASVTLGETLGEGGMGVVSTGIQASLNRTVAVKRPKSAPDLSRTSNALLREAVITGMLQHPNIVPVYDLGLDEAGKPMLVMKRIQGTPWDQTLTRRPPTGSAEFDPWLETQLRVLMEVCDAVRFAHHLGIIHRDLKPENVMLGDYGEVLVVDWGIAVSLLREHAGYLPLARDISGVAGTLAYMSREQATADGNQIGEGTDVYLLGATLYELLQGRAPHERAGLYDALKAAVHSQPDPLSAQVSPYLAAICSRAMQREPSARYASVKEFQDALAEYLVHKTSIEITQHAYKEAEALASLRAAPDAGADSVNMRQDMHRLFSSCRFRFQQALDIWPANTRAADGLQSVLETMIEHSLSGGDVTQAVLLLQELPRPRPALKERVLAARAQRKRDDEGLRQLGKIGLRHDLRVGRIRRFWVSMITAMYWTVASLWSHFLLTRGEFSQGWHLGFAAFASISIMLYAVVRHSAIRQAGLNQRYMHVVTVTLVAIVSLRLFAALSGLEPARSQPFELLLFFVGNGAVAALAKRRLILGAFFYAVAAAVAARWMSHAFLVAAVAHTLGLAGTSLLLDGRVVWGGAESDPA